MRYQPTIEKGKWVTAVTKGNGNGGLHDQTQFKEAVLMLEEALSWDKPALYHVVLTGATTAAYAQFISKLMNLIRPPARKLWKAAVENSESKGLHLHMMLMLSSEHTTRLFDIEDSTVSKLENEMRLTHPSFNVEVISPKRHKPFPGIPLTDATFDDACEWISYFAKSRSKETGGQIYSGSRRIVARTMLRAGCLAKPRLNVVLQVNAHFRTSNVVSPGRCTQRQRHTYTTNGGSPARYIRLTTRHRLNSALL